MHRPRRRGRVDSSPMHSSTPFVPRVALGAVATPASCDRGGVRRMPHISGRLWAPPSSVLTEREVEEEGDTRRAHLGPNIPRSRSESSIPRVPSRHERGGPSNRCGAPRGSSSRPPALLTCPIGCGHHIAERSDLQRAPSPRSRRGWRSGRGWRSVGGSQA